MHRKLDGSALFMYVPWHAFLFCYNTDFEKSVTSSGITIHWGDIYASINIRDILFCCNIDLDEMPAANALIK